MSDTYLRSQLNAGIYTLTLNRPEKHNAFDEQMISELTQHLQQINNNADIRIVLITAEGRNFCAGADLNWMQRMANFSLAENKVDAGKLANLLEVLAQLSKPTIALVQGRVMGGGIGLVACADIVIASDNAEFCFSEVKLGLIPATIAPYIIRRIGDGATRRYFLSAETFTAAEANRIGLVQQVVNNDKLLSTGTTLANLIKQNAPLAITAAKKLLNELSPIDAPTREKTAHLLAEIRSSAECKEGLQAFLTKRKPNWIRDENS